MARARNIKPSIMDNEDLADLDPLERLLFIYLWMLADREGRLEDRPKRIAKQAMSYDRHADADAMLANLQTAGFLRRYQVGGHGFIQILNFVKHQAPHGTEKDSAIPDDNGFLTVHERGKNGYATGSTRLEPCSLTVKTPVATDAQDSDLTVKEGSSTPSNNSETTVLDRGSKGGDNALIPDAGFLIQKETPLPPKGGKRSRPSPEFEEAMAKTEGFTEFYEAYPRKDKGPDALKAYRQVRLHEKSDERALMMSGLAKWRVHEQWRKEGGHYVPLPATWLRNLRWRDESVCGKPVAVLLDSAGVEWFVAAGFDDADTANNYRCYPHNAHEFRNRVRIEEQPA